MCRARSTAVPPLGLRRGVVPYERGTPVGLKKLTPAGLKKTLHLNPTPEPCTRKTRPEEADPVPALGRLADGDGQAVARVQGQAGTPPSGSCGTTGNSDNGVYIIESRLIARVRYGSPPPAPFFKNSVFVFRREVLVMRESGDSRMIMVKPSPEFKGRQAYPPACTVSRSIDVWMYRYTWI